MCAAAAAGSLTRIRSYHLAGADLSQPDVSGRTALHLAALHGHVALVQFLLGHGVEVGLADMLGQTAADVAARSSPECRKLLAEYGKV